MMEMICNCICDNHFLRANIVDKLSRTEPIMTSTKFLSDVDGNSRACTNRIPKGIARNAENVFYYHLVNNMRGKICIICINCRLNVMLSQYS